MDKEEILNLFDILNYTPSAEEVKSFYDNFQLVDIKGMGELNKRLKKETKPNNFFSTLAEHNFAAQLLRFHPVEEILYEDKESNSIDFTFWKYEKKIQIQMKCFSVLKDENLRDRIRNRIIAETLKIPIGLFFSYTISNDFDEKKDIEGFINFIQAKAENCEIEKKYYHTEGKKIKGHVDFFCANKQLKNLTLASSSYSDFDDNGEELFVDITGHAKKQIFESLEKAAEAFKDQSKSDNIINLIAVDSDNQDDIDICDGVFGTEAIVMSKDKIYSTRLMDGYFKTSRFAKSVDGIIILRRKLKQPVSDYNCHLYLNPDSDNRTFIEKNVINVCKNVEMNMRPRKRNFEISF